MNKNSQIFINPSDFKRVLSNLLDNAVEACDGKGSVKVILSNVDDKVEILVSDSGSGIADDVIVRLFKPGATFGKPDGKGLGLVHAKATIEAASGKIGIFSRLGIGTEIKIVLSTYTTGEIPKDSGFRKVAINI